jgi:hypothetical protein
VGYHYVTCFVVGLRILEGSRTSAYITLRHKWLDTHVELIFSYYRGADKSLARPGRRQATATEDFDFHISYL